MGSAGYACESHLEKYLRDSKIVQRWLGGAERNRPDIAQGRYGPFRGGKCLNADADAGCFPRAAAQYCARRNFERR